jgi:DNA-binding IclR family transcriptional regulator
MRQEVGPGLDPERPQVVARVGVALRVVAAGEPDGLSTSQVARGAALARATAHRLLSALSGLGMLDRDPTTGRWHLGPEIYLLGLSAAARYDVSHEARSAVRALAAVTGESAFFSARRGDETVCLVREDGSFPLRSHVLYEGIRFPLGVASAGLAILAHLPDREIDSYLVRADLTHRWGQAHAESALRKRVDATRSTGYAVNPGLLVEGSWGLAAAVFDREDRPSWALTLTGVESRFRPERLPELGRALLDAAHHLSNRIRSNRM